MGIGSNFGSVVYWLYWRLVAVFVVIGLTTPLAHASDPASTQAYAALLLAEADYERMLTERRLADAEINLINAQIALDEQLMAYWAQMRNIMRAEFDRITQGRLEMERRIRSIETAATLSVARLANGDASRIVFSNLRIVFREAVPIPILVDVMKEQVEALPLTQFLQNVIGFPVPSFSGGSRGQLFEFIERQNVSLVRWGEAHMEVMNALGDVQAAVEGRVREYQAYIQSLISNTLPIWNPPIPPNGRN